MIAMDLASGRLGNIRQAKSVTCSVRPHRYVQDFYIDQFRVTAMDFVFGCLGNQASQKRIFRNMAAPLRIGFLYWLL
jgi:hypothetical protein